MPEIALRAWHYTYRAAMVALTLFLLAQVAAATEAVRPNILLVVLDDFGYNDLAINNGSDSPTPTLDKLARQGIRYTRHYAESSCSPSRAALLTGQYAARHGFHPVAEGLDPDVVTLPDLLATVGYTNYMIGKWHLGNTQELARPQYHGFHHWFGFLSQMYLAGPHEDGVYHPARPTYLNPWLEDEQGQLRQHPGHLNDLLTERTLDIVRSTEDPWFVYLSYYAPHTPLQPAPRFANAFEDSERGRYQALKAQMDANLGKVFAQLVESGQWDDTLIIVVSDNGGTGKAYPSNKPFQGEKVFYLEGGVRSPLLVSWPAVWRGGEVRDDAVAIFDIYPSIASLLGVTYPSELDGLPTLIRPRPRELRWYSHGIWGDRYSMLSADGQWRLVAWDGFTPMLLHESEFGGDDYSGDKPSALVESMMASMKSWRTAVTEVSDLVISEQAPWREYRGSIFRRSPISGAYSIGLPLLRGSTGAEESPVQLLTEAGFLQVSALGDKLIIEFDGQPLTIESGMSAGACSSLIMTTVQNKKSGVQYWKDTPSQLAIYLGGELVSELSYQNFDQSEVSTANTLRVRTEGSWAMPAGADVVISTRLIGSEEIARELHPRLIDACP